MAVFLSSYSKKTAAPYDVDLIVNQLFISIQNVKTLRYDLKISERVDGEIISKRSAIKLNISPRNLYVKLATQEILWLQGKNNNNALVNPGSFPYISLNLDPFGSLMRKGQHHTIHELGIGYIYSILKNYKSKFKTSFKKHFFIAGEEVFDGRTCYKLVILDTDFNWKPYTVLKNENLVTIARKLHLSEFMILEKNSEIDWYDDVDEGQIIQIPSSYCKYAKILVDKETMLPVSNTMIDEKGLFESYKYTNLRVNTKISSEEFDRDYKDYDF